MELENRTMKMLLQSMPKKGFVLTFVIFFVLFTVCVIIGATGPYVYDIRKVSAYRCPDGVTNFQADVCEGVDLSKPNTKWSGEIQNLDKLNQELLLRATLENKNYTLTGITKELSFVVQVGGRNTIDEEWVSLFSGEGVKRSISCAENSRWCNSISLAHELFIQYSMYQFNVSIQDSGPFLGDVEFAFIFVNHSYTLYELWFRFVFLILTFVVVILYAYKLKSFNWKDWTSEQKYIVVLLFGLMAYNNPFYPLEILVEGWFPIFLNRVLYASFLVMILFFWLVTFDGLRKGSSERGWTYLYLPKVILLGLFWIVGVVLFTWSQLYQSDNPTYSLEEIPAFIFFQVFEFILLIIYVFWLLYIVCRACGDAKTLPYLGLRIKFFGIFTLLVMFTAIGGVIFGVVGGLLVNNTAEFISFLALFNLYVWTLAFVYLPAGTALGSGGFASNVGMVRLEGDDDFEEDFGSVDESKRDENVVEMEDKI